MLSAYRFNTILVKSVSLVLLAINVLSFVSSAQSISSERMLAKEKINAWVVQTNLVIAKDSFHRMIGESQYFLQLDDSDKKRIADYFSVKTIDSQWYSIRLDNLIKVDVDNSESFHFKIIAPQTNDKVEEVIPALSLTLLSRGFVHGENSLRKLSSKVSLYSQGKDEDIYFELNDYYSSILKVRTNKLYLSLATMGQSLGQEIKEEAPKKVLPEAAYSTSVRDYLELTPKLSNVTNEEFETLASTFIEQFYTKSFNNKAKLTNKTPPTAYLEQVQGYVTPEKYWENVQVKFDNIQIQGKRLMIQCSIDGEYVKLKTSQITKEAFERPFILERDYPMQINSLCYAIIQKFKHFIINN